MYSRLTAFANHFSDTHPSKPVDGEYYDVPGVVVYRTATLKLPEKGRIEINILTSDAPDSFEWEYEITLDDRSAGTYTHLLLRRDRTMVETYGKTVLPVDDARADELLEALQRLGQPTD